MQYREAFPSLADLNALIAVGRVGPVVSGGGFPVQCVRQQRVGRSEREKWGWKADYQLRIFFSGEVSTRPSNWHDFFNAWSWIHFPKSKAALNARHFHAAEESISFPWRRASGNRNREQDLLTLFDEGGLIVVTDDDELWRMIQERRWQELFHEHGQRLRDDVAFLPIGHALYECALAHHPRIHASAVRVRLAASSVRDSDQRIVLAGLARVDEMAALLIKNRTTFHSPDALYALPIWGIPGWHARARDPEFIADKSYFR